MDINININFDFTVVITWSVSIAFTIVYALYRAIKGKQKIS
ncbi:hypothetical protein PYH69_06440 [Mammaliicoccus lentus]|uniref:Uncharacterized protein n=1 Tax=Mammaliicoccus lentus TaxID=42858 RepID=A0AAX3W766_MAMLE|nr:MULTISPECIES: hypothetical protein [Mammaliicoccus]WHI61265.1 hypothetical protein PYH69_06440 [Mammaliicoccus lentus]